MNPDAFECMDQAMLAMPYLENRVAVAQADDLIARYGDDAGFEAAALADRCRNLGNAIGFCRWRQIERLIVMMATRQVFGSVH